MDALFITLFILSFGTALFCAHLWQKIKTFCELYDVVSHNSIENQRYLDKRISEVEAKLVPKVKKTSLTENTNAPIKKNKQYRKEK